MDDTEVERLPQSRSLLLLLFGWGLALLDCAAKLPRGWCPVAAVCLRYRVLLKSSQNPKHKPKLKQPLRRACFERAACCAFSSTSSECSTEVKEIIK